MTKQILRIKGKALNLDYSKWHGSILDARRTYLNSIGINDADDINELIHMPFHLLPYTIRTHLQTKIIA